MYGKDPYIVAPNVIGYMLGMWYSLLTLGLSTKQAQQSTVRIIISGSVMIYVAGAVAFLYYPPGSAIGKNLLGIVSILLLMVFYSSPLSSMAEVIRKHDAQSLNPLLAIASVINCVLWSVYGLVLNDIVSQT